MDIVDILKDKPKRINLYSSVLGNCTFAGLVDDEIYPIGIVSSNGKITACMMADGKYDVFGECLLFPSKAMRDWNRFSWKIGDVLSCGVDNLCVFDSWANDDYTEFHAKYVTPYYSGAVLKTKDWSKVEREGTIKDHISKIEEIKGGTLNLETLEIEKYPQFKDGDIVTGDRDIAIYRKIYDHTLYYYASLDKYFGLMFEGNTVSIKPYRLATDSEKNKLLSNLAKIGKKWNPDTKQVEDLPKEHEFKTLDYMLVRDKHRVSPMWQLYQYAHEDESYIYAVGSLYGLDRERIEVFPYNDKTAHLLGTTDDWKGGEE